MFVTSWFHPNKYSIPCVPKGEAKASWNFNLFYSRKISCILGQNSKRKHFVIVINDRRAKEISTTLWAWTWPIGLRLPQTSLWLQSHALLQVQPKEFQQLSPLEAISPSLTLSPSQALSFSISHSHTLLLTSSLSLLHLDNIRIASSLSISHI